MLGIELDAIRQSIIDSRGETTRSTSARSSRPSAASSSAPRRAALHDRSRRPGSSAPPACASPRSSTTWRSATTSCTASGTGCATPRSTPRPGSGTCHAGRAVEVTATTSCTTPTPTSRQGQRPRLRHHARRRGPDRGSPFYLAPAALELHQRRVLRVRHRRLRPRARRGDHEEAAPRTRSSAAAPSQVLDKIRKQATKDYVVHPLLSIPSVRSSRPWRPTSPPTSCATSGPTRSSCAATSPRASRPSSSAPSRARPRASGTSARCSARANISGSKLMHLMTGNLSHQIEHHLFPDLPSNRYGEIAPQVRGPLREVRPHLLRAAAAAAGRTRPGTRWSGSRCPTAGSPRPTSKNVPQQLGKLYKMVTGTPRERRLIQASLTREARRLQAA